jgi:hypothetical protein
MPPHTYAHLHTHACTHTHTHTHTLAPRHARSIVSCTLSLSLPPHFSRPCSFFPSPSVCPLPSLFPAHTLLKPTRCCSGTWKDKAGDKRQAHHDKNEVGELAQSSILAIRLHECSEVLFCVRAAHGQNAGLPRVQQPETEYSLQCQPGCQILPILRYTPQKIHLL